eukprot:scaffold584708_cov19-Prasinocladus_malaysianus.AAC.1
MLCVLKFASAIDETSGACSQSHLWPIVHCSLLVEQSSQTASAICCHTTHTPGATKHTYDTLRYGTVRYSQQPPV